MKLAIILGALLTASAADAAVYNISFTVNPGSWQQNNPGQPFPFGLDDDPTLYGTVSIDRDKEGMDAFVEASFTAGDHSYQLSDLTSATLLNWIFYDFGAEPAPRFVLNFGPNITISNSNTAMIEESAHNIIFCNGCVSSTVTSIVTAPPAPVPEPVSWTLIVGGFGLIGSALRRGRRQQLA